MFADWLTRLIYGRRIRNRLLDDGLEGAWPLVARVLSQGTVVYDGRVGAAGTLMYPTELLTAAIEEPETAQRLFAASATTGNATLAAYCLKGLELLDSERLPAVAAELVDRKEVLHVRSACFGGYQTLAELAKLAAERHTQSPALQSPDERRRQTG